jgi:hypothetical protein
MDGISQFDVLGSDTKVTLPCVDIDKDHWKPHPPSTLFPVGVGIALLAVSVAAFAIRSRRFGTHLVSVRRHARAGRRRDQPGGDASIHCGLLVVFKKTDDSQAVVDPVAVRRALALIAS